MLSRTITVLIGNKQRRPRGKSQCIRKIARKKKEVLEEEL